MSSEPTAYDLAELREAPFDAARLEARLAAAVAALEISAETRRRLPLAIETIAGELGEQSGATLQERWEAFEAGRWAELRSAASERAAQRLLQSGRLLAMSRAVRPGWPVLWNLATAHLLAWAPPEHPLVLADSRFAEGMERIGQLHPMARKRAPGLAIRLLLRGGYRSLEQITEEDLMAVEGRRSSGIDTVDAALCALGVFERSPQRGYSRHRRARQPETPAQMVARAQMPDRFREVTRIYLEQAKLRNGYAHSTLKTRISSLARFWRFIEERFPEVEGAREIGRGHGLAYREAMIEESRTNRRSVRTAAPTIASPPTR